MTKDNKYDLVIFDCDGTLIDSEVPLSYVLSGILSAMGFDKYTPEMCYNSFVGIRLDKIVTALQMDLGVDFDTSEFIERVGRIANKSVDSLIKPMAGATTLLQGLDLPKCVASNGDRRDVIRFLKITNLLKFFKEEEIFTYQQVARPKPAPDVFIFAAEQMGVFDASRCLVVEDSEAGIAAAEQAGMDVVVLRLHDNKSLTGSYSSKIKGFIKDLVELNRFL